MYLVARAQFKGFLSAGRMESSQTIKLGIHFEIFRQLVPHYHAGEPSTRTRMNVVVSSFPVQIDGPELFGKLQGQNQAGATRSYSARDRIVRIINRKLRKNRN